MKSVRHFASVIILGALVFCVMAKTTSLVEKKDSIYKYRPFFEHANEFDVLFMGTSHVINGAYPMELWKDFGITSYNFGGHANEIPTTYWAMENALDYCKPKVMVIDCLNIENNVMTSENLDFVHISLDAFPLSLTKIKAVFDLIDNTWDDETGASHDKSLEAKLRYLWDFSIYHSRWDELTERDFSDEATVEYGAESVTIIAQPNEKLDIPRPVKYRGYTAGDEYLRRMIEDCQRRGIEVLLTYIPFPASEEREKSSNKVYDMAEEYGVRYINFLDLDIVNYDTDVYDNMSHLNVSGAKKVTAYLGENLQEYYDLPDHRNDAAYSHWSDDYLKYQDYTVKLLDRQAELNSFLLVLADHHYGFTMTIDVPEFIENEETRKLFDNIGVDSSKLTEKTRFIGYANGKYGILNEDIANGTDVLTSDGAGKLYIGEEMYGVYFDGIPIIERETGSLTVNDHKITVNVFSSDDQQATLNQFVFYFNRNAAFPEEDSDAILKSRVERVRE